MYNPGTDSIVITNSVKWSVFNPWQAQSMDETTKNLKTDNKNTTKCLTMIDNVRKTTDEVEVVQVRSSGKRARYSIIRYSSKRSC